MSTVTPLQNGEIQMHRQCHRAACICSGRPNLLLLLLRRRRRLLLLLLLRRWAKRCCARVCGA
jgi:hypothetical protein